MEVLMRATPFAIVLLLACAPALAQGRGGQDRAPAKGTQAPDFELQRLSKTKTPTKEKVKLSEVCAKKPVALIFGSYT